MPCDPNSKKSCKDCSCAAATSTAPSDGAKVALPSRAKGSATESTPLLWEARPISTASTVVADVEDEEAAPPRRCEKLNGKRRGVCCRELKSDDERTLLSPDTVRDIIIGLSDGLTVPFALTAGLSGVGSSRLVVLAGLAELVSGAISMGVGGFLSAQAEVQHYNYTSQQTRERVARSCMGEMEREVSEILEPYGVSSELAERVAAQLQRVESEECGKVGDLPAPATLGAPSGSPTSSSSRTLSPFRSQPDASRGLTAFLLSHDGLEPVATSRIYMSALTIGLSYLAGGAIPLLPYVFIPRVTDALLVSILVTGAFLLAFGVAKQRWTGGACDSRGYVYGALSTLSVGALAAGASFLIVRALEGKDGQ